MKIFKIINDEKEFWEEENSFLDRKTVLKKLKESGKKIALGTLPISIIGLTAEKASAQFENLEIGRALNFLVQIEFMQEAFYIKATSTTGLIDNTYQDIFRKIRQQHRGRVILIKNNIGLLDIKPVPQLKFNFNVRDQLNPFSSFDEFLNLAQVIEDTAAGVYKKQIGNIIQNNATNTLKQTVLRLHSTESRHAYFVRSLRAQRGLDDIKGWIDQANLGTLSSAFVNIYDNEDNTIQEEIDVPTITNADTQAVQEAWDEPIGRGPAGSILQLFTNPL